MKTLALIACLFSAFALAATPITLPNPSVFDLIGRQCGKPVPEPLAAGFSADGNYVLAIERASTSCSTGGRGSRPKTYSGDGLVRWDLAGNLIEVTHPRDFELYPAPAGYDVYIADGHVVLVMP
jgi:hypothetical protein